MALRQLSFSLAQTTYGDFQEGHRVRFLSLFSGIEAASVAWMPLGWECLAVAEVETFCCTLLSHYYPMISNLGDVREITSKQVAELGVIDVVVFGFPCQDLSIAGKREGLVSDDGTPTRSGLFFDAMRIVNWSGARWAVAENVPGLFSSNEGRDFAAVVGTMAGADVDVPKGGWQNTGVAAGPSGLVEWCVLDAQWFGVPQRRRRVFIVRDSGNWRDRPPVLFNRESLRRNPQPSREAQSNIAGTIAAGAHPSGFNGRDAETGNVVAHCLARGKCGSHGRYDPNGEDYVVTAATLRARDAAKGVESDCTDTLVFDCKQSGEGGDVSPPLRALSHDKSHANAGGQVAVAYQCHGTNVGEMGALRSGNQNVTGGVPFVVDMAVRRLTPRECERLQGFPDDYPNIPYGRPKYPDQICPDGPRYKALGNSMAVPVMRWIGERIKDLP